MPTKTYGNGNQTIVEGSDETIIVGNGNDSVTAGSNDLIAVGNGNDTISVTTPFPSGQAMRSLSATGTTP
jgi:hypothetical protein